ncbi:MAG: ferrous iron transport protein A [Gemmataceae bacterium]
MNSQTLNQLLSGQRASISAVDGDDSLVQRLLEMGLLEGEEVEVLGFAPLGDPMEIRLRDYRLCLRKQEAARIRVAPLAGPTNGHPSP